MGHCTYMLKKESSFFLSTPVFHAHSSLVNNVNFHPVAQSKNIEWNFILLLLFLLALPSPLFPIHPQVLLSLLPKYNPNSYFDLYLHRLQLKPLTLKIVSNSTSFSTGLPATLIFPLQSVLQKEIKDIFITNLIIQLFCLEPFRPNSSHLQFYLLTKVSSPTGFGLYILFTSRTTVHYWAHSGCTGLSAPGLHWILSFLIILALFFPLLCPDLHLVVFCSLLRFQVTSSEWTPTKM